MSIIRLSKNEEKTNIRNANTNTAVRWRNTVMVINFQNSKKLFFLYMIDHLKFDILTKFGEKINTGSMLKLGLNLVSKNVIIF